MEYLAGITNSPGGSFWRVIDVTTGIPPIIFGGISADDESRHADVHEAKHEGDARPSMKETRLEFRDLELVSCFVAETERCNSLPDLVT